jgi:hypothetical protein
MRPNNGPRSARASHATAGPARTDCAWPSRTFSSSTLLSEQKEACFGEAPKPTSGGACAPQK